MARDNSLGELVSAARQGQGSYLDMKKLCTGSNVALLTRSVVLPKPALSASLRRAAQSCLVVAATSALAGR